MSAIKEHNKKNQLPGCMLLFFGIFLMAGMGAFVFGGLLPLIQEGYKFDHIIMMLFSLPFSAVGLGGFYWFVRSRGKNPLRHLDAQAEASRDDNFGYGSPERLGPAKEIELKGGSPFGRLFGMLFVAAFWNGIVSIFIFSEVVPSFERGDPEWGLIIFLSIFGLVGIGLIGGVFYFLLALGNPRPALRLHSNHLRLGSSVKCDFELNGNTNKLTSLVFTLVGVESATYRRGTDTVTATETFYEQELARFEDAVDMRRGTVTIEFPAISMPTWEASNNKVNWQIKVLGDIPLWPDISETFFITLYPALKS